MRRLTVPETAEALGITTDAVRMQLSRGTLASERHEGRVYVLLENDITADRSGDTTALIAAKDETIEILREQLRAQREQLQAEREAHAEARRIIAGLVQRVPELEAAPESPPESPETTTAEEAEQRPGGAQEGAQRPWWRRWFGG
jgi:hypothetical protein